MTGSRQTLESSEELLEWEPNPRCQVGVAPRRLPHSLPFTRLIVGSGPVGVAETPCTQGNRRLELPFSFIVAA